MKTPGITGDQAEIQTLELPGTSLERYRQINTLGASIYIYHYYKRKSPVLKLIA
jgi:hypothetical protein